MPPPGTALTKDHYIPITEQELAKLIEQCGFVTDVGFGTGGLALVWKAGEPMPAAVRRLGLMRGVLNENCEGAGI